MKSCIIYVYICLLIKCIESTEPKDNSVVLNTNFTGKLNPVLKNEKIKVLKKPCKSGRMIKRRSFLNHPVVYRPKCGVPNKHRNNHDHHNEHYEHSHGRHEHNRGCGCPNNQCPNCIMWPDEWKWNWTFNWGPSVRGNEVTSQNAILNKNINKKLGNETTSNDLNYRPGPEMEKYIPILLSDLNKLMLKNKIKESGVTPHVSKSKISVEEYNESPKQSDLDSDEKSKWDWDFVWTW